MNNIRVAIIVAGGTGTRMGSYIPKQFLDLLGEPILMHTIRTFHKLSSVSELIIVLPELHIPIWVELCKKHHFDIPNSVVKGGKTRFHSVCNGLAKVTDQNALVAIHDGVRPLVSLDVIERCYAEAERFGNAIPAVKPVETVRFTDDLNSHPLDREQVMLVQTPQVFKASIIKRCYQTPYQPIFTDDASVAEFAGEKIHLVEGNRENIKITTPLDISIAEVLLKNWLLYR